MLMALFQNKESLSSNKTTRVCGQADKNVQLQARPRGLIGVRRDFNLLLHPIVIRRLTIYSFLYTKHSCCDSKSFLENESLHQLSFQIKTLYYHLKDYYILYMKQVLVLYHHVQHY